MRRGLERLACLCGGHAIAAALFVGLINVPDANVPMLSLSMTLVVLVAVIAAMTTATVLAWWMPGVSFRDALGRAFTSGVPAAIAAAVVFAAIWWSAGRVATWHEAHRGEMDAWFIATFNAARTGWLHWAIGLLLFVARAILATSVAVAIVAAAVAGGGRAIFSFRWLRAAFSRLQVGVVAMSVVLLIALPWRALAWRPPWVLPGAAEPVFVGLKLAVVYLLINAGWALVLFAASRAAVDRGAGTTQNEAVLRA